ncbi:MAG: DNA-binding protein [Plesiomonas shigelloides]
MKSINPITKPLMNTKEVADYFRVSVSTVLRWNSINKKTGMKYRPSFPDPDIKSCPNKWATRSILSHAGTL